jgi:diketogulonate reductase-like aldo/keto reductase
MKVNSNSVESIPALGFGTFRLGNGSHVQQIVEQALDCGYRHIDTAPVYGNQIDVGKALKNSGLCREDLFLTTKIPEHLQSVDAIWNSLQCSMDELGIDCLDMCLVHWPNPENRDMVWQILMQAQEQGMIKFIGVSNFLVSHLLGFDESLVVRPYANQFELSPFCFDDNLTNFCERRSIKVVAYCLLSRGARLTDSRVLAIGKYHNKTSAQVIIRWAFQHGWASVVTSKNVSHMRDNLDIFSFELSLDQMSVLDSMNEKYRLCWDPSDVP